MNDDPGPDPDRPPPGSDAAILLGCTCPVLDNGHGKGWMGLPGLYVFHLGCPVHDPRKEDLP